MAGSPASSVRGGFPLGLAGATAATRYVGATASGAPASGTFAVGDFCIDQTGKVYVCSVAGTPGTWVQIGASSSLTVGRTVLGSGNLSTASASFVDATGLAVTIATGAHSVLVVVQANIANSAAGNAQYLDVAIDGTRQGGTNGIVEKDCAGNNFVESVSFSFVTAALTAASHTFQLKWRVGGGTSTLSAVTATLPASIAAIELAA